MSLSPNFRSAPTPFLSFAMTSSGCAMYPSTASFARFWWSSRCAAGITPRRFASMKSLPRAWSFSADASPTIRVLSPEFPCIWTDLTQRENRHRSLESGVNAEEPHNSIRTKEMCKHEIDDKFIGSFPDRAARRFRHGQSIRPFQLRKHLCTVAGTLLLPPGPDTCRGPATGQGECGTGPEAE